MLFRSDSGGLKLLYGYAGYDPENTVVGYIPGVGDKIFKMVSRVTFIAYGITFVMFLFYPLNKKRLEDLQTQLTEQRALRMAQESSVASRES